MCGTRENRNAGCLRGRTGIGLSEESHVHRGLVQLHTGEAKARHAVNVRHIVGLSSEKIKTLWAILLPSSRDGIFFSLGQDH